MATPNYGYEKRQKELAKKRKKEDKLKAKAGRKADGSPDTDGASYTPDDALEPGEPGQAVVPVPVPVPGATATAQS